VWNENRLTITHTKLQIWKKMEEYRSGRNGRKCKDLQNQIKRLLVVMEKVKLRLLL